LNDTVRSAARVLDLLEQLSGQEAGLTLSETAARLGLPKSSALALLRTLVARGYAGKDASDRYVLNDTFRLHGFGWGGHRHARLVAVAGPLMEKLSQDVGETVLIGIARAGDVQTLAKAVANQDLRYDVDLARPCPFYCTAMGRVLTAFAPEERQSAMLQSSPREKVTASTVTDLDRLHAIIAQVRAEGVAIVEEEWVLGGTGIAVPVFQADGTILAALDIGCVTTRFQAKREGIIAALRQAGDRLTQALSARSAPPSLTPT
jgi:DNA-binding IclR family transcriptional regulator